MGPDEPEAQEFGAVKAAASDTDKATDEPRVSGSHKVSTVWPHGDFIIEDVPVVTREGVELSGTELDNVLAAAKESGVQLVVEDGN